MNISNWNYPTTVWFGEGRIKEQQKVLLILLVGKKLKKKII